MPDITPGGYLVPHTGTTDRSPYCALTEMLALSPLVGELYPL